MRVNGGWENGIYRYGAYKKYTACPAEPFIDLPVQHGKGEQEHEKEIGDERNVLYLVPQIPVEIGKDGHDAFVVDGILQGGKKAGQRKPQKAMPIGIEQKHPEEKNGDGNQRTGNQSFM